jgi:hypothetical protein
VIYLKMGTPDYEVYVPSDKFPVVIGIQDFTTNEQGEPVKLRSVLYYPERSYATPLKPKEVVKRFEETSNNAPNFE